MKFVYSDGGRSKYFKTQGVGDCVTRAICNATGKDYREVYNALNNLSKRERTGSRKQGISSSRNGVYKVTWKRYLESIGWEYSSLMGIGTGCRYHLNEKEFPKGTLIMQVSRHLTCIKDGVLYDTYDCSRDGNRCVYGFWKRADDKTRI